MDDNYKIKGISKGTKGRKDKNKQSIYSSKHVRNQVQNKTTIDTKEKGNGSNKDNEKNKKQCK